MTKLEKEAIKYAEYICDQAENISLDNLRDYAKTDFIAGAEWNKSISKAPEMLEMLETYIKDLKNIVKVSDARDLRIYQVETLIKEVTEI